MYRPDRIDGDSTEIVGTVIVRRIARVRANVI